MRKAQAIFDLEDRFLRDRGTRGRHPLPLGEVRIEAIAHLDGDQVEILEPSRRLITRRNPSGYWLFFGQCEEPPAMGAKPSRRHSLAAGTYRMRVVSEHYQPTEPNDVVIPEEREPYSFNLEPSFNYPFPRSSTHGLGRGPTLVRGVVQGSGAVGLADAVVHVGGASYDCRTDSSGQWVLVFPDAFASGEVTVEVHLADGRAQDFPNVAVEQGATRQVPTFRF